MRPRLLVPPRSPGTCAPRRSLIFFFFNDTATTEIYTLSLHDALPIYSAADAEGGDRARPEGPRRRSGGDAGAREAQPAVRDLRRQEVSEPGAAAHRSHRRGQRRAAHGRAEIRSRSGRQVHLVRRVVDPPG